jgi:hypothetical protein
MKKIVWNHLIKIILTYTIQELISSIILIGYLLKNFVDFGSLPDSLFVLGNMFRAYLSSPYTIKSDDFVIALNYMLNSSLGITDEEKQVVLELLEFISE